MSDRSTNSSLTCDICGKTIGRSYDLRRHKQDMHGLPTPCPVDGCERTFKRVDRLKKHVGKSHHGYNSMLQLIQVSLLILGTDSLDHENRLQYTNLASTTTGSDFSTSATHSPSSFVPSSNVNLHQSTYASSAPVYAQYQNFRSPSSSNRPMAFSNSSEIQWSSVGSPNRGVPPMYGQGDESFSSPSGSQMPSNYIYDPEQLWISVSACSDRDPARSCYDCGRIH